MESDGKHISPADMVSIFFFFPVEADASISRSGVLTDSRQSGASSPEIIQSKPALKLKTPGDGK